MTVILVHQVFICQSLLRAISMAVTFFVRAYGTIFVLNKKYIFLQFVGCFLCVCMCVIFEVDAFKLSFRRRHSLARHAIFLFYVLGERRLGIVETLIAVLVLRSHATLENSLCDVFEKVPSHFPSVLQTSQVIIGCKWRDIAQNSSVLSHRRDR